MKHLSMIESEQQSDDNPAIRAALRLREVGLAHLAEQAAQQPAALQPELSKQATADVVQLPLWPQAAPGAPNPVLRSALFPAIQSKDRRFINNEIIASLQGQEIKFKGEQLNQEDLEVWLQVLHLAQNHPLGTVCHASGYGLLKALDRQTGNTDHKQLHAGLTRLLQPVTVTQGKVSYSGGLIMEMWKDDTSRQYLIRINPRLVTLFGQGWTQLDTATRRKLRGKPLALWLQAHYATHAAPYPYSVAKLRELSGSQTANLKHFRAALRRALSDLQGTGAIAGFDIDPLPSDLVHIHKVPTITQQPHRGRKAISK
jgi:hypothetical protein